MSNCVPVDDLTHLSEEQREGVRRRYGDAVCQPTEGTNRARWILAGFVGYLALGSASFLSLTPAWTSAQNLVAVVAWVVFPVLALTSLLMLVAIELMADNTASWIDDEHGVMPIFLKSLATRSRRRQACSITSSAFTLMFLVTAAMAGWLITSFMLLVCWALSHVLVKSARTLFVSHLLPKAIAAWDAERDARMYGQVPGQ